MKGRVEPGVRSRARLSLYVDMIAIWSGWTVIRTLPMVFPGEEALPKDARLAPRDITVFAVV